MTSKRFTVTDSKRGMSLCKVDAMRGVYLFVHGPGLTANAHGRKGGLHTHSTATHIAARRTRPGPHARRSGSAGGRARGRMSRGRGARSDVVDVNRGGEAV